MHPMSRRQFLQWTGAGAATLLVGGGSSLLAADKATYPYELPKLPYALDALEPHIDAKTMEIHHGKHHKAYVDNLNNALKEHPDAQKLSLHALLTSLKVPDQVRVAVRNNGGGHLNHSMFWQMMSSKGGEKPKGALAKAIDDDLGGFDKFQTAFTDAAMKRFGSGWAWLIVSKGKLTVSSTPNQDSPVMQAVEGIPHGTPILGIDVWEHAYYLKYQNLRAAYVKAWWNVVNWDHVAELYNSAKK
jgi:superoxide dismutase, Fe-Mn family